MNGLKGSKYKFGLPHVFIAAIIISGAVVTFIGGKAHNSNPQKSQEKIYVVTQIVTQSALPNDVFASGTIRPIIESKISPKIMSNVSDIYVKEGDHVRKGQVLIRLESNDLQAQVMQTNAAFAAAKAAALKASTGVDLQKAQSVTSVGIAIARLKAANEQLSIVKEGPRKQEKAQAQLAVAQADAQLKLSEVEYNRSNKLFEQGAVSKQSLDRAQADLDVAKAKYESTKQQADLSMEGSRTQEIRAAEEQVRQAEEALKLAKASALQDKMSKREAQVAQSQVTQAGASLQYARTQLGYSVIKSPISGVITKRYVDPGDTVSPGMPIIAIEDDSLYRLEATVPDKDADSIYIGKPVDVLVGSKDLRFEGKVSVISPSGDPGSRKFLVKVDLAKNPSLRSGNFGRMVFPTSYNMGFIVSDSAIHDEGGLTFVFTVGKNNKAKMQVVKLGRKVNSGVEIVSGLAPGDELIISNTGVLADGVSVVRRG